MSHRLPYLLTDFMEKLHVIIGIWMEVLGKGQLDYFKGNGQKLGDCGTEMAEIEMKSILF